MTIDASISTLGQPPPDKPVRWSTHAYVPATPWKPWAAIAGLIAIVAGVVIVMIVAIGGLTLSGVQITTPFAMIFVTLVQQAAMIGLTWFAATRFGGVPTRVLALGPPVRGLWAYGVAFALMMALTLTMDGILAWTGTADKSDIEIFRAMLQSPWAWLTFVALVIGAPLSEELLFRGFLFSALSSSRIGTVGAAFVTSFGFAILHPYSIVGVVQVFCVGMLFAGILVRTGSLRVTLVCHALSNLISATLHVMYPG